MDLEKLSDNEVDELIDEAKHFLKVLLLAFHLVNSMRITLY